MGADAPCGGSAFGSSSLGPKIQARMRVLQPLNPLMVAASRERGAPNQPPSKTVLGCSTSMTSDKPKRVFKIEFSYERASDLVWHECSATV